MLIASSRRYYLHCCYHFLQCLDAHELIRHMKLRVVINRSEAYGRDAEIEYICAVISAKFRGIRYIAEYF